MSSIASSSNATRAPSSAAPAGGPPLLAWWWMVAGFALFAAASLAAWDQAPSAVPLNRAKPGWSLLAPIETNPHRRLPVVLDDLKGYYAMADGQHVWVVGDHGRIFATSDGARDWHPQESNTIQDLARVEFRKDGMHGWAGDAQRALVSTSDGGNHWDTANTSWSELQSRGVMDAPAAAPRPPPPSAGVSVAADAAVAPAAATGTQKGELARLPIRTSSTPAGLHGWAAGDHGTLVATDDSGRSWHPQTATSQSTLYDLWLDPSGARAWAVGAGGTILASTDGGATWTPRPAPTLADLTTVTCRPDAIQCWVGGTKGRLFATADAGRSWTLQESASQQTITGLHFSKDQNGWANDATGMRYIASNGGAQWGEPVSATQQVGSLRSLVFPADDDRGWAVAYQPDMLNPGGLPNAGSGVSVMATKDGGQHWDLVGSPAWLHLSTTSQLFNPQSVSFDKNGLRGVVVERAGDGPWWPGTPAGIHPGMLAITEDGGAHWDHQKLSDAAPLEVARLAGDGRQGLAIGRGGQFFATNDGGRHWRPAEHYGRLPAPWYWPVVALSAWLAWLAWRLRPKAILGKSIANLLASDNAVLHVDEDRLGFDGLARGISRFLRNTETRPPLTLAVTGDWGSGKSSLMQLVCADLRRFGHRPIWFNAWHHQKEEHLFASLLGAIYSQAAPPLRTFDGLSFRLRLLWVRSRRHFLVMMLAIALVSALSLLSASAWHAGGFANIMAIFKNVDHLKELYAATISALLAGVTVLVSLKKGATTFKANPAVLLRATWKDMSLKTADAQNSFRTTFARQFDELTRALPYRLAIVIDDLDRCAPGSVIEVLEAVNYLTSSGNCFVIFGMATERVTAALGLAFKEIAAEMVQHEGAAPDVPAAEREMAKRRAYATDYLQKLVNIEIKVPVGEQDEAGQLLVQSSPVPHPRIKIFVRELATFWPLLLASLALAAGLWLGEAGEGALAQLSTASVPPAPPKPADDAAVAATPAVDHGAPTGGPAPAVRVPAPTPPDTQPSLAPAAEQRAYAVQSGDHTSGAEASAWTLLGLLPVLAVVAAVALLLWRRTLARTEDSEDFKAALAIWTPLVAARRNTPRAIKRFGNRLRYLAMLQQGEAHEETVIDRLRNRLRDRLKMPARPKPPATKRAADRLAPLPEHQLIAIGAVHELYAAKSPEIFDSTFRSGWTGVDMERREPEEQQLVRSAMKHIEKFSTGWPPSSEELASFEHLMAGVRLPGDPQPPDTPPDTPAGPATSASPAPPEADRPSQDANRSSQLV